MSQHVAVEAPAEDHPFGTPDQLPAQSRAVLNECVRLITGRDDLPPRTGQARLLDDIAAAYTQTHETSQEIGGQVLGAAPTGTGKSVAYLAPAMVARALLNQRTVISTEMISLQTQIIDKDAPVVAQAVENITGFRPTFALLKGWSNYSCALQTMATADNLVGPSTKTDPAKQIPDQIDRLRRLGDATDPLTKATIWALEQAINGTGDKNTYEGDLSDGRTWEAVSVASSDCIGAARCAFADWCLPRQAREAAAEADVVVTNHHLLAVQAAKGVSVVIGNKNLGDFEHLVIDEAHGLPSIVRGQGAVEVSSRVVQRVAKGLGRLWDDTAPRFQNFTRVAEGIADRLDEELNEWAGRIKKGEDVIRLGAGDDPLNDTTQLLEQFLTTARDLVKAAESGTANVAVHMKAKRVRNTLDGLAAAMESVSEHEPGSARWVEVVSPHPKAMDQSRYPAARFTPVNVSPLLRYNLWTCEDVEAIEEQADQHEGSGPPPRKDLTVVALSATLPKAFGVQMGMRARIEHYESPFDDAYGASVLFVPRALPGSADVDRLRRPWGGAPKFDTGRHADWAAEHTVDLVEANGGSALVLAATATAGRAYAEQLRRAARGRWRVLSQWDGPPLRRQVAEWKGEESAVLVGTKSLMTGVDAPGETCSLVVVDRPARSRSNPVDEARVEGLMESQGMDKWAADRLVYVADAGALLEQAAGRLIRQVSDAGMVAVLDPRLLKSSPFAYNHATRGDYLEALARFETKIADPARAHDWLRGRRQHQAAA